MTKVLMASAASVALIAMHRDPAEFPPPYTADVHPDEVANFVAGGWREGGVESAAADAPQDPALMSREQLVELHLAVVRGQIEQVSDDELRHSLVRYQDRQKFNGADPAAFDHDGDNRPGGSAPRSAAPAAEAPSPGLGETPPPAADGVQQEARIEGGGEPAPGEQASGETTDGETLAPAGDVGQAGPADAAPAAHDYSDAAHAKSAQLTIAEIRADLTAMEVEFDPKTPKADLLSLRNAERQKRGKPIVGDPA